MSLPKVRIAENLKLIAHHTLNGAANTGEGFAMKVADDGRRYLYIANEHPPIGVSVLDVTDPSAPDLLFQIPTEHERMRTNSLAVFGDTLLVANQVFDPGMKPAGVEVFDISDPAKPEHVSYFDTSGPHSIGVHRVSMLDGRYAHLSTGAADFEPKNPDDHQFYMIVDFADRENPVEVGRWWLPGQRVGDPEEIERHPVFDRAFRPHHTLVFPERPDRCYMGYVDGGVIILDISDKSSPKMISRYDYSPPAPGFTHTVLPLFDRGIAIVSDEATGKDVLFDEFQEKRYWIVDISYEKNPTIISCLPTPEGFDELRAEGGRIGAHNIHENEPLPGSAKLVNTCVATWFSAGLRVYDIRDKYTPKEIGAFLPETPEGQQGSRISEVYIDDRGYIFVGDRDKGGLYILEWTGDIPLD